MLMIINQIVPRTFVQPYYSCVNTVPNALYEAASLAVGAVTVLMAIVGSIIITCARTLVNMRRTKQNKVYTRAEKVRR